MIGKFVVRKKVFLNEVQPVLMYVYEIMFPMLSTYKLDKVQFLIGTKDINEWNY